MLLLQKDAKSNKKKLYNEVCRGERKLLEQFLIASSAKKLSDVDETNVDDAWLCYNCQSALNKLEKLRKDVQELETHLFTLASSLHPVSHEAEVPLVRKCPPPPSATTTKAFCSQVEDVTAQLSGQTMNNHHQ